MPRTYDRDCNHCGEHYEGYGAKYCSESCAADAKRGKTHGQNTETACQNPDCDTLHDNQKYCSPECMNDARRKRDDERECGECGETFEVPARAHDQQYCSKPCYSESQRRDAPKVDLDSDLLDYTYQPGAGDDPGTYYFPVNQKLYPIPEDTWEYICECYSEMGRDMTRKEVAREVGISFPVLKRILRLAGQFKASLPFSRERVAEEDEDALVDEALETKERKIVQKLQRKERKKLEREHRQMYKRLQDETRHTEAAREIVDGLTIHVPEADSARPSDDGIIAHVPTADCHVGLYVWGEEGFGKNYDTDIACERLVEHGRQAAAWLREKGGAKVVYRSDLGDFFHADEKGETARGTYVDLDTRLGRVWSMGLEAMVENVLAVHSEAERTVVKLQKGNHDAPDTVKFKHSLALALKDVDGIEVEVSPHPYSSFRVGETQHILDHGYHVSKRLAWKATAQAEGVARSFWEDFQAARWHYTWMGHLHSREVGGELDHHEIVRLEALCEANDYETELRFDSRPAARLFELDARGREKSSRVLRADDLTPDETADAA